MHPSKQGMVLAAAVETAKAIGGGRFELAAKPSRSLFRTAGSRGRVYSDEGHLQFWISGLSTPSV